MSTPTTLTGRATGQAATPRADATDWQQYDDQAALDAASEAVAA
ncbi:hypothetical protein [Streptomyces nigrescens]